MRLSPSEAELNDTAPAVTRMTNATSQKIAIERKLGGLVASAWGWVGWSVGSSAIWFLLFGVVPVVPLLHLLIPRVLINCRYIGGQPQWGSEETYVFKVQITRAPKLM